MQISRKPNWLFIGVLLFVCGCSVEQPMDQNNALSNSIDTSKKPVEQIVLASYYGEGDGFSGKKTASGEIFNPNHLTAAHRTLPFGTIVEVRNISDGKSCTQSPPLNNWF